jgi:hypothetical protein
MNTVHGRNSLLLASALTLVAGLAGAWPSIAAAGGPPVVTRSSDHKSFFSGYDDGGGICGNTPPAWITFIVTDHETYTDKGVDAFNLTYGEHGTISVDYDDPAVEDVSGQFADAQHFNLTNNGASVFMEQFHDFRGGVKISVHTTISMINGVIRVHRDILNYTGC